MSLKAAADQAAQEDAEGQVRLAAEILGAVEIMEDQIVSGIEAGQVLAVEAALEEIMVVDQDLAAVVLEDKPKHLFTKKS